MDNLNDLEKALAGGRGDVDFYLGNVTVDEFIKHIEEIKKKAALTTDAGVLKAKILELFNNEK